MAKKQYTMLRPVHYVPHGGYAYCDQHRAEVKRWIHDTTGDVPHPQTSTDIAKVTCVACALKARAATDWAAQVQDAMTEGER